MSPECNVADEHARGRCAVARFVRSVVSVPLYRLDIIIQRLNTC